MKLFLLLILAVFASEKEENGINDPKYGKHNGNNEENPILVKIEEDEYDKVNKKSKYIGVYYDKSKSKWRVQRKSKNENTMVCNGYYGNEETAAHASDTLARKLLENGEQNHKLNFPDDHTEVYPEEKNISSKFIGVFYDKNNSKWRAQRWNKNVKKRVSNGYYDDEETAAHASDTLAKNFKKNGEQNHKLNFPDDHTEVYPEEEKRTSKYIGVSYYKNRSNWNVQRFSKNEKKTVSNGYYDDEETAAHASDTLARRLMKNGEHNHKLNFPDKNIQLHREKNQKHKRKRPKDFSLEHHQNN